MTALFLALLSLGLPVQEPVAAETPAQVLDARIERTNALDSFLARWSMRKGEEATLHITLRYQAPDRMRLDMDQEGDDGEGGVSSTWVVGTRMAWRMARGEASLAGDLDFAALPGPIPAALYELDTRFPMELRALGPGCTLDTQWSVNEETDRAGFDVALVYDSGDRTTLVGWLRHMRDEAATCKLEGEQLTWSRPDERIALRVSPRTGFLEALDMVSSDGGRLQLRLEQLDLAPALEAEVFEVTPRPEGADEMFPDGGAEVVGGPVLAHGMILARVNDQLEQGLRAWDEGTREDARAVLHTLHAGVLTGMQAGMGDELVKRLGTLVSWMREERAKTPPGDPMVEQRLREAAAQRRDGFSRFLDAELPRLRALVGEPPADLKGEHLADLVALDQELVAELLEQLVRAPLLEALDQLVAEVLGD